MQKGHSRRGEKCHLQRLDKKLAYSGHHLNADWARSNSLTSSPVNKALPSFSYSSRPFVSPLPSIFFLLLPIHPFFFLGSFHFFLTLFAQAQGPSETPPLFHADAHRRDLSTVSNLSRSGPFNVDHPGRKLPGLSTYARPKRATTVEKREKPNHTNESTRNFHTNTTMSHSTAEKDPSIFPLTGGCACGNIRYSLNAPPMVVHCCHCTSCQRETGTAFALNAVVEGDEVTLLPSKSASLLQPLASFPESAFDDWTPRQHQQSRPADNVHGTSENKGKGDDDTDDAGKRRVQADIPSPVILPVPADSGAPQHIARCPICLTPVWSNYDGTGPLMKFLRVGTLDAPALLGGPDVYIFMRSKLPFVEVADDGKPRFDEFYPTKEGVWGPQGLARREKLLVRIKEWRKENGLDG
ncbi:glutathione-dependent formaldehyde-activating [Colletotrichum costaricense]|uniref:Glutathione-dependent formaldehyde-activating n=1 Tax=Colletotrichum costaricense TaxID=1209916 RepID=A0AAI9YGD6_9PEZI|nr:glutathione-dependent formaldehyde-activating [Colletotrichum costaricense]KAK1508169.1 glutathione-dependent formaldehyde-activating [Colletotrichum costaricense]